MNLDELEILLLVHELILAKFKKQLVRNMASLNLTHMSPQSSPVEDS